MTDTQDPQAMAVFVQLKEGGEELLVRNMTLERVLEEVVVPYNTSELFFIDGIRADASKIHRIKILVQQPDFEVLMSELFKTIAGRSPQFLPNSPRAKSATEDAIRNKSERITAIVEQYSEDITSQMMDAYAATMMGSVSKLQDFQDERKALLDGFRKRVIDSVQAIATGAGTAYLLAALG